jgi:hypothetical protein
MPRAKKVESTTHRAPFVPMVGIVPPGKQGDAEVEHFTISEADAKFSAMRAAFGHPDELVTAGDYVSLKVRGGLMMSDTPHEQRTSLPFVQAARGDVLIAGLGLGMVLVPVLKKPEVASVVVVEQSPSVAALVGPYVATEKLTIFVGDIHEWRPPRGTKYDTIFFDIWADVSYDHLTDMNKLHHSFQRYLRPGGWMDSWKRRDLLYR